VFSDSSVLGIEECVMEAVLEHNKLAATVDTSVNFVAYLIVNVSFSIL